MTSGTVQRRATGAGRLSTQDWTTRALQILVDEGVGAIKVARLCRELGVTKGSFYWHLHDLEALKKAVADRWCADTRTALSEVASLGDLPPLERVRNMATQLVDDRSWSVERELVGLVASELEGGRS